ncbi:hypothetical protein NCAS_0C05690 [Naumovozyma castellii]|uniref:MIF4G domain-containing protein n=1 Tax=Naumovozyma castellii TaxID=27288 RepID=G0VDJ7_NAUCA|nr:hypothetical protein NCAS_0C05690 [Naumovozyma castellii CBS 4309]CCC69559.1 hypothetical protein NCAS_0C05690 [Naumovozyma castellii CBS 4309]
MSEQVETKLAVGETNPEDVRRSFIEQVKARKAALEKKKQLEQEAAAAAAAAAQESAKETEPVAEATPIAEETKSEEPETPKADEAPKQLTFAERLKLKKQAAAESAASAAPVEKQEEKEDTPAESAQDVQSKQGDEDEEKKETEGEEAKPEETEAQSEKTEETEVEDENTLTVSKLLTRLAEVPPIDDIFTFKYPEGIEGPSPLYKKETVKYTYGPTFLLQFKDTFKVKADEAWVKSTASKVVIPPGMGKGNRSREPSNRFGGRGGDFRNNSGRGMDDRSNSRASSKRKSRRNMDDRRSNRSYTNRKEREMGRREEETPKEEVAPFVPSANRWIPKSKAKKTEKKFAPDGVTELLEKEDVERKMKSLLNKLTLEKFDPISTEILEIANQSRWEKEGETLKLVIEQIFLKACDEPHWSSMYAQLCGKVVKDLSPEIADETNEGKTGPKLILHYLVARCHTEFQKGWTDKLPTNEDGTPLEPEMMSDEYYQAASAKRRGLGLVRFIGFLYCLNLLTGKMMFECFRRLMKDLTDSPSEETLESVVELLTTVGAQFETDTFRAGDATLEGSALLDSLFQLIQHVIDNEPITSRIKFKLIDIQELRGKKNWDNGKKDSGPKTITQIHEEEERARQLKNNSRSNSRRVNNSNRGSRRDRDRSERSDRDRPRDRDHAPVSKDSFTTTRSFSQRNNSRAPPPKEEPKTAAPAATNMFSALMDDNDDEE